jgi:hypothetical protein
MNRMSISLVEGCVMFHLYDDPGGAVSTTAKKKAGRGPAF